jgi:uncharacterized RDD family membrane protein YckC
MGVEKAGVSPAVELIGESASVATGDKAYIYGGFWRRLAALTVNMAILIPYGLMIAHIMYASRYGYVWNLLGGTCITLLFNVYWVKRFGGSPGTLILGMRILRRDGGPVRYRDAMLRCSVLYVLWAAELVAILNGVSHITDAQYTEIAASKRPAQRLNEYAPWYEPAIGIWVLIDAGVLVSNRKRRAAHDFMAGTMVVRTRV